MVGHGEKPTDYAARSDNLEDLPEVIRVYFWQEFEIQQGRLWTDNIGSGKTYANSGQNPYNPLKPFPWSNDRGDWVINELFLKIRTGN